MRRRLVTLSLVFLLLGLPGVARGEDPPPPDKTEDDSEADVKVDITTERLPIPFKESAASVTIIGRDEIEQTGSRTLGEVLRWVPGLQLAQTGGRGQFTSLFTRGTESNHTLIMIDGFQVTSDGGTIDLSKLTLDNVERIEIHRGAGSSIWGSDAIGGVINIVTRRGGEFEVDGEKRHFRAVTSFEAGTFASFRQRTHLEGGIDGFSASFEENYYTRREPTIDNSDVIQRTRAGNFGLKILDNLSVRVIFRDRSDDLEIFSAGPGPRWATTDRNDRSRQQEYLFGGVVEYKPTEWWMQTLRVSQFRQASSFSIRPDTPGGFQGRFLSEFRRRTVDWQHTFKPDNAPTVVVGFEWEEEKGQTKDATSFGGFVLSSKSDPTTKTINRAYYAQAHDEVLDDLFVTVGARVDDNSSFGSEITFNAGAAYTLHWTCRALGIDRTKFRANFATGIKEPTLFERFSNSPFARGNPSLTPERSRSWEAGVDQDLFNGKATASYTFFYNNFSRLIDFNPAVASGPQFFNAGRAMSMGHEISLFTTPAKGLTIRGNVTLMKTEAEKATIVSTTFIEGDRLLRRADITASVLARYQPQLDHPVLDRFAFFAQTRYVGDRDDTSGGAVGVRPRQRNSAYTRTDVGMSVKLNKYVKLIGRFDNVFNAHYEEVLGFPADGMTFLGGIEFSIDL